MTERQRRFIAAYSAGADAAEAAAQAGYSPRRARRQAKELLARFDVAQALDAAAAAAEAAAREGDVDEKRIRRELARIAFAGTDVRDGDKLRALEMLTKLLPGGQAGGDDDAARCGVVILPEVMAPAERE